MNSNVKRVFLYSLVASVALGALLAIAAVLRNTWSWFEIRVILSTLVVAAVSLCVMACELSRTPKGMNILPYSGFALSTLSALGMLLGMWTDQNDDAFWRAVTSSSTLAIATVHVCLLSVVPLAKRFKWVYLVAMQLIYGLAFCFIAMILDIVRPDSGLARVVITLAILCTAISLVLPILSRISRVERARDELLQSPLEQRNLAAIDAEIAQHQERIAELEKLRRELTQQIPPVTEPAIVVPASPWT